VVACGTPSELTTGGSVDETWFSTSSPLDIAGLAAALGLAPGQLSEPRPREYVIATAATPALVADLAVWLRDRDVGIVELRSGRPSLEEVFLRLTREPRP
jgi:hypothetical protein